MATIATRGSGRRRRSMSEINMVPFIDVMLVLLIIFMVSAPLITTGEVKLPSVARSSQRDTKVVEVIVDKKGAIRIKGPSSKGPEAVSGPVAAAVQRLQAGDPQLPVVISADGEVKYEAVMDVMSKLKDAGVARVGLSVKQSKAASP